jgi:hypothetical protein
MINVKSVFKGPMRYYVSDRTVDFILHVSHFCTIRIIQVIIKNITFCFTYLFASMFSIQLSL